MKLKIWWRAQRRDGTWDELYNPRANYIPFDSWEKLVAWRDCSMCANAQGIYQFDILDLDTNEVLTSVNWK